MKGVTILKNEKNNRKIIQVDIKEVAKRPNEFEDFVDVLIAEDRKDEKRNWLGSGKSSTEEKRKVVSILSENIFSVANSANVHNFNSTINNINYSVIANSYSE